MVVDPKELGEGDRARVRDEELSLTALKGEAVKTLKEVLHGAESDDVRRKAAVDILNFNKEASATAPTVTEEQLEYLGHVIVETEAVRLGKYRGESEPRSPESVSTH